MSETVVDVVQAGVVPYAAALEWQRTLAQARIERRLSRDVLLLVEHPPTVTLGRNSHRAHVLYSGDVEVFEVERGGDVTYHGPGQLVGYPILDLGGAGYRRDLHWYLRALEQALIDALAQLGIPYRWGESSASASTARDTDPTMVTISTSDGCEA